MNKTIASGILVLAAFFAGSAPVPAQALIAPLRVASGNPESSHIIQLATALQQEYPRLLSSMRQAPWNSPRNLALLARYQAIFRTYWRSVARYQSLEIARRERDPRPAPRDDGAIVIELGPAVEGTVYILSEQATAALEDVIGYEPEEIDEAACHEIARRVLEKEGMAGLSPPAESRGEWCFQSESTRSWVIRSEDEWRAFQEQVVMGEPVWSTGGRPPAPFGGMDGDRPQPRSRGPGPAPDFTRQMVIATSAGLESPRGVLVTGGSQVGVGLPHQYFTRVETGTLRGHLMIVDRNDEPVYVYEEGFRGNGNYQPAPGIEIRHREVDSDDVVFRKTDARGRFSLDLQGKHLVEIEADGYAPIRAKLAPSGKPVALFLVPVRGPSIDLIGAPRSDAIAFSGGTLDNPF